MKYEELALLEKQFHEAQARLILLAADLDEKGKADAGSSIRKQVAASIDAWCELRNRSGDK